MDDPSVSAGLNQGVVDDVPLSGVWRKISVSPTMIAASAASQDSEILTAPSISSVSFRSATTKEPVTIVATPQARFLNLVGNVGLESDECVLSRTVMLASLSAQRGRMTRPKSLNKVSSRNLVTQVGSFVRKAMDVFRVADFVVVARMLVTAFFSLGEGPSKRWPIRTAVPHQNPWCNYFACCIAQCTPFAPSTDMFWTLTEREPSGRRLQLHGGLIHFACAPHGRDLSAASGVPIPGRSRSFHPDKRTKC
jgi:hypothetical protein